MSRMIEIEGLLSNLYVLHPEDSIPDSWKQDDKHRFLLQGETLFQYRSTVSHSLICKVQDSKVQEIIENYFNTTYYDPDKVHLVDQRWEDFTFDVDEFRQVMKYFQDIYNEYDTEACVLLMIHPENKDWKPLYVLQASGNGAQVTYAQPAIDPANLADSNEEIFQCIEKDQQATSIYAEVYDEYMALCLQGYRIYGTIHSHCDFAAFHSGTDDHDEIGFDGLHITVGNVNSNWSFSLRFMLQGSEQKVTLEDIFNTSEEEIVEGIENVNIPTGLQDRMIPDLIHRFRATPKVKVTAYDPLKGAPTTTPWDHAMDPWNVSSQDEDRNSGSSVWDEDEVVRLYDYVEDLCLIVRRAYYLINEDEFGDCVKIPFGEIPQSALDRHEILQSSLEDEFELEDCNDEEYEQSLIKRASRDEPEVIGGGSCLLSTPMVDAEAVIISTRSTDPRFIDLGSQGYRVSGSKITRKAKRIVKNED